MVPGTHCRKGKAGHNVPMKGNTGDMQRSQTVSAENCGEARNDCEKDGEVNTRDKENERPMLTPESSLQRIRYLAQTEPELVFTSLAHRIDLHLLEESLKSIRKDAASGVDKVTVRDYVANLEANLYNLHQRLRRGQYVAQPVKRVWIDKEGGKKRPIGIPVLEDKIVQRAVATILMTIYEVDFYDFSYGFREGRGAHTAIEAVWQNCQKLNIQWVVDADVSGYFDNISHRLLREFVKRRVNDGGIIRLIGKWLNAGVMEEEIVTTPSKGTPQGGVISPVLANVFLHYVLDEWFVKEVRPRLSGRCFLVRYADDFIVGFESERDARRFMEVLPKRFERFELEIHPEKSKLVDFRPTGKGEKGDHEKTFDFLGFTHYRGKSRKGNWIVKRKTISKRMRRFMSGIWEWCRKNRHKPIAQQHVSLTQKLRGYYQYYGIIGNYKALRQVLWWTERAWQFWLNRRTHKGKMNWEKYKRSILGKMPLPRPRIIHSL